MKILFSHRGIFGKDGWGRSFFLAQGMASLGHEVVFLTIQKQASIFRIENSFINGVTVISYPEFFPKKLKSSGFGLLSLLLKIVYSATHRFDIVFCDVPQRPVGLPCKINRKIYKSFYVTEWWDYYGTGGYFENKPWFFKLLYGRKELKGEINERRNSDHVVVLSQYMKEKAKSFNIKNVDIVHGGCCTDVINPSYPGNKNDFDQIVFGYIGMCENDFKRLKPFFQAINSSEKIRRNIKLISYGKNLSQKTISQNNLDGIIEQRGWLDYSSEIKGLEEIDIFLQLLDGGEVARAGWPNKLGDYLSFGKPVMLHPYGDLKKFVENNPEGFITIKYDSNDIIETINNLLRERPDLKKMGIANRKLAERNTWTHKAAQIFDFIKKGC
ncbi:MAG: glycosyltransferase [Cytophagia bacterium]|nr:glycosyltransferase [Cytophagia bacterium]